MLLTHEAFDDEVLGLVAGDRGKTTGSHEYAIKNFFHRWYGQEMDDDDATACTGFGPHLGIPVSKGQRVKCVHVAPILKYLRAKLWVKKGV